MIVTAACHYTGPDSSIVPSEEAKIDSSLEGMSSNMIISPGEWQEDSIFNDGSKPPPWSIAGINDGNQLKIFIKFLRLWVEKGNRDSIAAHLQYPLRNLRMINSPSVFLKNYDRLFNKKVIKALEAQKLSQIFRNSQGAMIGNGELWISNVSPGLTDVFKIVSINN